MFILLFFLLLTSVQAATAGETIATKTLAQSDNCRLQALKRRLHFDDLVQSTEAFDNLALQETFTQASSPIPPFFHYVWVGGPLHEEYWLSITRLAMLLKKTRSPARVVVWVDDSKNLEFLKVQQQDKSFLRERNQNLSTYKAALDIRNIDALKGAKPDFFTPEQYTEYWNIINFESRGFRNLAAVSDMVRLEALRQWGGIYLDTDVTPLFYTLDNLQPSLLRVPFNFQIIHRNNSVIVSTPHHPFLKVMMRNILIAYMNNFLQIQEKRRTDRPLMTRADRETNKRFFLTIRISGPGAFHKSQLVRKITCPLLKGQLILPIQSGVVSSCVFLPEKFYTTVSSLLSGGLLGEVSPEREEKMERFLEGQKEDSLLDSNTFLMTVLKLFKRSLCAPKIDPRIVTICAGLLTTIHDQLKTKAIAPGGQIALNDTVDRALDCMIDHFQNVKLDRPKPKSTTANFGVMQFIRLFDCLNFRFDCHNTWMGAPSRPPAFDAES